MSLVIHRHRKHVRPPTVSGRTDPGQMTFLGSITLQTLVIRLQKAIASVAKLFAHVMEAIAEARMHRAMTESELCHGRYRLSSKNDDDLPIVPKADR